MARIEPYIQIEAADLGRDELGGTVSKAIELSQTFTEKWDTANSAAKRRILEILCLNCKLDDVTLCRLIRSPFDLMLEGLSLKYSRGDWI